MQDPTTSRGPHEAGACDFADVVTWPALLVSTAGWSKVGRSRDELTDASPRDDLAQWQSLTILDAAGRRFRAVRVTAAWPTSRMGRWLCRLSNHVIHVEILVEELPPPSLQEFRDLVVHAWHIDPAGARNTPRDILEEVLTNAD